MGFSIYDNIKTQIVGYGEDIDKCMKLIHNHIKPQLNTDITMDHPSEYNYDVGYYLYYIDGKIMLINILTQITNNIWRFNEYTNIKYIKTWELLEHAPIEEQIRDIQLVQSEEPKNEQEKIEEPITTQSTSSLWGWLF